MSPIVQLYWLRVTLGIVAAAVTAVVAFFVGGVAGLYDYSTLLNSVTIALLIYFITYYIFRGIYKTKIEKQSKILSTGIGMYFFSWIAFFVLFYTIVQVLMA